MENKAKSERGLSRIFKYLFASFFWGIVATGIFYFGWCSSVFKGPYSYEGATIIEYYGPGSEEIEQTSPFGIAIGMLGIFPGFGVLIYAKLFADEITHGKSSLLLPVLFTLAVIVIGFAFWSHICR